MFALDFGDRSWPVSSALDIMVGLPNTPPPPARGGRRGLVKVPSRGRRRHTQDRVTMLMTLSPECSATRGDKGWVLQIDGRLRSHVVRSAGEMWERPFGKGPEYPFVAAFATVCSNS
jgi:hypothetical protein